MNTVPIIVITKNPDLSFVSALDSLQKTNLLNNPLIVVDDSSDNEKSIDLLYSNKTIEFKDGKILGLKGKYNIIKTPNHLGKLYRVLFAINVAFKLYSTSETCVLIDDAKEFNEGWLNELNKMYESNKHIFNISMLTTFIKDNRIEGKIVMFTNKFYQELKKIGYYSTADFKGVGSAYMILQKISHSIGFNIIK